MSVGAQGRLDIHEFYYEYTNIQYLTPFVSDDPR
jgi:hypothetical protein